MRRLWQWNLVFFVLIVGCARTLPGTHVELVDDGGAPVYVAGAVAPGMNSEMACGEAVGRCVAAIALRFSQEQSGLGDDVAKQTGLGDGIGFLKRYASSQALTAVVQETHYNPGEHLCVAMVRWKAPLFLRDGLLKYAQDLKDHELRRDDPPAARPAAAAPPQPAPPPSPARTLTAPPPPTAAGVVTAPPCLGPKQLLVDAKKPRTRPCMTSKSACGALNRTKTSVIATSFT